MTSSVVEVVAKKTKEDILQEHHKISAEIENLITIREHLIDQIHKNKCTFARKKYKLPQHTLTSRVYHECLFLKKKSLNGFSDVWPWAFKDIMEDTFYRETMSLGDYPKLGTYVYYNVGAKHNPFYETQNQLALFDLSSWNLEKNPEMTPADIDVITRYISRLSLLFATLRLKSAGVHNEKHKRISKEIVRIMNLFGPLAAILK